jgi:hypothetical protein
MLIDLIAIPAEGYRDRLFSLIRLAESEMQATPRQGKFRFIRLGFCARKTKLRKEGSSGS